MSDVPRDGSTSDSLRDLAPGYALGALSPEEARAFEAALAASPELQREVAEYRELSALLAMREERLPPAALKERLRERIGATKSASIAPPPEGSRGGPRGLPIATGIGLAALLVLSVGLTLKIRTLSRAVSSRDSLLADRDRRLAERETTLNALLEPAIQLTTLTASGEAPPVVQVFWNRASNSLILHTFRLKPAPAGRIYQLWLMRKNGKPIPSQVFNTEPGGHQLVQAIKVPAGEEIAGFALTEEPEGGSPQPTSTPILFGSAGTGGGG